MRVPCSLQQLPPRLAHVCLGVERFLERDLGISLEAGCVVGCSGGADSTVLTIMLRCLTRRRGGSMAVAHLNHMLRPEAADEQQFVGQLCNALDVPFYVREVDVAALAKEQGVGVEEAGRSARYDFFSELRQKTSSSIVCVAHHLNDLAEDVLMRLGRGTGWPGLGGMAAFDSSRGLVRPLLLTPKAALVQFLREIKISWCEDASNGDTNFARNRIRQDVLPLFLQDNPNFLESVQRLWRQAWLDRDYWEDRLARIKVHWHSDGVEVSRPALAPLHQAERLRFYKQMLDALGPGQVRSDSLFQLDKAFLSQAPAVIQFPGFKIAAVNARTLRFGPDPRA